MRPLATLQVSSGTARTDTPPGVASHHRCHILIGDVMCLAYMTSVVRLGGSVHSVMLRLRAGGSLRRRAVSRRAEELLELFGDHVGPVDEHDVVGGVDDFHQCARQLRPVPLGRPRAVLAGLVAGDQNQ